MYIEKLDRKFWSLFSDGFHDKLTDENKFFKISVRDILKYERDGKYYYELSIIPKQSAKENVSRKDVRRAYANDFEILAKMPEMKSRENDFQEEELEIANHNYLKLMLLLNFENRQEYMEDYVRYQIFKNQPVLKGMRTESRIKRVDEIKKEAQQKLNSVLVELSKDIILTYWYDKNVLVNAKTENEKLHKNTTRIYIDHEILKQVTNDTFGILLDAYGPKTYTRDQKIESMVESHSIVPWTVRYNYTKSQAEPIFKRIEKSCEFADKNIEKLAAEVVNSGILKPAETEKTMAM